MATIFSKGQMCTLLTVLVLEMKTDLDWKQLTFGFHRHMEFGNYISVLLCFLQFVEIDQS